MEEYVNRAKNFARTVVEILESKRKLTTRGLIEKLREKYLYRKDKIFLILVALYNHDIIGMKIVGRSYVIYLKDASEERLDRFAKKNWILFVF